MSNVRFYFTEEKRANTIQNLEEADYSFIKRIYWDTDC